MDLATWLREASSRQGGGEEPDLSILQGADPFAAELDPQEDTTGFDGGPAEATGSE
jgi:hypothetical protein